MGECTGANVHSRPCFARQFSVFVSSAEKSETFIFRLTCNIFFCIRIRKWSNCQTADGEGMEESHEYMEYAPVDS